MRKYNPNRAYEAAQARINHALKQKTKRAPHGPIPVDTTKTCEIIGRDEQGSPVVGVEIYDNQPKTHRQTKHEEYLDRQKNRALEKKQVKQTKITRRVRKRGPMVGLLAREVQVFDK